MKGNGVDLAFTFSLHFLWYLPQFWSGVSSELFFFLFGLIRYLSYYCRALWFESGEELRAPNVRSALFLSRVGKSESIQRFYRTSPLPGDVYGERISAPPCNYFLSFRRLIFLLISGTIECGLKGLSLL